MSHKAAQRVTAPLQQQQAFLRPRQGPQPARRWQTASPQCLRASSQAPQSRAPPRRVALMPSQLTFQKVNATGATSMCSCTRCAQRLRIWRVRWAAWGASMPRWPPRCRRMSVSVILAVGVCPSACAGRDELTRKKLCLGVHVCLCVYIYICIYICIYIYVYIYEHAWCSWPGYCAMRV